ncbi:NADP-dependent oxidoreductase [Mesorhizobium sp. B2-1-3A]|uniref:NADP-dependent oxidoreductase n=1 Tax=Mesorhizobium sp. B2-1-3A TaxID=2589971 RepID=UPI00112B9E3E|nr:NADP-dependent oxidoreductase [Mesorhizobium sp. B2-1-3A]TPM94469.1 NADP-dependent oxidoreductase [Mesorhizobium sp. B2-1-3A]
MRHRVIRSFVLASRPQGAPVPDNFRMVEAPLSELGGGQVLLQTLWLSLDPYMRGSMDPGPSYTPGIELGRPMPAELVSTVVETRHSDWQVGDVVVHDAGWQDYTITDGTGMRRLDARSAPVSTALGILGMPGMTAFVGLANIAEPKPGETLVVAAAAGPVGSTVGQIAKIKGCRVVGIAGGERKRQYLRDELGFDAALDHRDSGLAERLAEACPHGIDIYWENVGGRIFEVVLPLLNPFARVPVCGLVALYSDSNPTIGPATQSLMRAMLTKRLRIEGFIVDDHSEQAEAFRGEMSVWLRDGRVRYREDITDGFEHAPSRFIAMLRGETFGKTLVRL